MEQKKQVFYRGALKSCNYKCEYCPFSKHSSLKELHNDKIALERFTNFVVSTKQNIGAIFFVPYGEALIHKYYWENIAKITKSNEIEAVGCQTNLSFSIQKMLSIFQSFNGDRTKLRLWCTFHPTMVKKESFIEQCKQLIENDILFSVGAVGVPEQIELLKDFREQLPSSVYFWINPMDGLKRTYTKQEIEAFCKIDPFFMYNLKRKKSNPYSCNGCNGNSMFVNAKGDITPCNISHKKIGNLYHKNNDKNSEKNLYFPDKPLENCGQRECSCFLSYSNRTDFDEILFYGTYPAFRIPKIPKIFFLDIDGTLVKTGSDTIEEKIVEQIKVWSYHSKIYIATSLPFSHAMKKCKQIKQYLSGGIFANGGMYWIFEQKEKHIIPLTIDLSKFTETMKSKHNMKVRIYKEKDTIYKILCKGRFAKEAKQNLCESEKSQYLHIILEQGYKENNKEKYREDYLEITDKNATKLNAVIKICNYYGYKREEVFAAGNSENDIEMLDFAGISKMV